MVKTLLPGHYFILKSANSTLDLVVSGTVTIDYARTTTTGTNLGRRRLRRQLSEQPAEAEKPFQFAASVMPEKKPTTHKHTAKRDDGVVEVVTIMPATTVSTT